MPIYEYRCEQGHTFEVMQRISDDPVSSCQTCEAPVQRLFHPIAVHFKGSGFYSTDYGNRKRSREDGDGKGEGSSTGESKSTTESKPASDSKPEKKPAAASSSD